MNLRSQPSEVRTIQLGRGPDVTQIRANGSTVGRSIDDSNIGLDRPLVIYVHGNRMSLSDSVERGIYVYRNSRRYCGSHSPSHFDWVIWSWPSQREGILAKDVRRKASRADGQAFLLANWLKKHLRDQPITMIGFSFGGRVISGSLHLLAGGSISGRQISDPIVGANISVGMIAPAIGQNWMAPSGQHALSAKNISRLTVLFNRRDAALKRFWLIDKVRGQLALGYSGPKRFTTRFDGSPLPVRGRDCSPSIGLKHSEVNYYESNCNAGQEMAALLQY